MLVNMEVDNNDEVGNSAEISKDENQGEPLAVEILPVIKEAQQHHGLRHGDYQRYRQYCQRRLKRIRNSLHFKLGTRHGFKGKKITEENANDSRYLAILLMEAERCWSAAMELKLYANTEPRKKFHMVRKLAKAAKYADELNSLCGMEKVDARTKLESQAYSYWMTANMKFEVQDWQTAIDLYTQARSIYEKLAGAFMDEGMKAMYMQRVDEISPNIRYCAYNLGQGGMDINELMKMRSSAVGQDMLAAKIDAAIQETREKLASSFGEVTWRNKTVPIRNEKARVFILRYEDKDSELNRQSTFEEKMEVFDNLMMGSKDALQGIKDEISAEMSSKKRNEINVSQLQFIKTYLSYLRQMLMISRNLLMIDSMKMKLPALIGQSKQAVKGKTTKPEDLIRLYDGIIQSLVETTQTLDIEDRESLEEEIEAQIKGYKAFRCFYIAQSYQSSKKWIEAVALYDRVITYVNTATEKIKACHNALLSGLVEKLESIAKEAKGHKYAAHAASILENSEVESGVQKMSLTDQVLVDRLESYQEYRSIPKKPHLVHFPPEPEALPCKPLFFDLALNHIDLPDLESRLEKKKEAGGISGFVKGWLWGNK
ncbi:signal recognition particle subunit SRP68-like [Hydractinia symbiolongicarpus]|uniref:signal recognition particle subunit SRP68-like n=1 Tax=Hydractinia symbiolongicarpus TaxID=13093 RepID=UPI00254C46D0|nr:signal recognition particle subunit SRP68-like [Hydractinia symbiolongicarpus]